MNIISLQHDYHLISLTQLGAPVKIIEVPILDIRVVEGMEGIFELEEQTMIGEMLTEEALQGTFAAEDEPLVGDMVIEEDLEAVFVIEEEMEGVFDPGDDCL